MTEFRFCFTLDTEPDDLWGFSPVNKFEHLQHLNRFHTRLHEAGSKQTYLTTSEVAESDSGRRTLSQILDRGGAEIGAHFHTWTREWPFATPELRQPPVFAMAHQLDPELESKMLGHTMNVLDSVYGVRAKSYRGGRWSIGDNTPSILAEHGIEVDSTVTPGLNRRDQSHPLVDGPDFRGTNRFPSRLYGEPSAGGVIEIPVGAATFVPEFAKELDEGGLPYRALNKLHKLAGRNFGTKWLRPTSMSVSQMAAVMRDLKAHKVPVWVFMIHSSEIVPCTPLPTQTDVDNFWQRCEDVVRMAQEYGAVAATLKEARDWLVATEQV